MIWSFKIPHTHKKDPKVTQKYIDLVIVLYVRLTVIYKLVCSKTMTNLHLEDPKPKVVNENRLDARSRIPILTQFLFPTKMQPESPPD